MTALNNKNFNSSIKPNTDAEKITVLSAVIEKKPVYYYVWNSQLTRMETMKFVGTMPYFDMYRYDTDGIALQSKSRVRFTKGAFVNSLVQSTVITPDNANPSKDFHVYTWFDSDGCLNIEKAPGAHVRLLQPQPQAVPVAASTSLDQEAKIQRLWTKLRNNLGAQRKRYRTAQPDPTNRYQYFSTSDMVRESYYAIVRLKDCVLVSRQPISKHALRSLHIERNSKALINGTGTVSINGYEFERHLP